jgi:arylsulfatase A-like enzyme
MFKRLALLICLGAPALFPAEAARPNVLFIFSDDQRADTIHALGNERIETPNLDRLVKSGTVFERAYCMGGNNVAVCIPARASLMTGRTLFRLDERMKGQGTWPEKFGQAGYATFAAGKWHNGAESLLRSFESGGALFLGGMGDPFNLPLQDITGDHKLVKRERKPGVHAVEIIADSAIAFLKRQTKDKPFLMYVAMEAPHDPCVAPPEFHAKYNANKPPLPPDYLPQHPFDNGEMTVRDEKLEAWPRTPDAIRQHLADYYASITNMDAQIGRILDALHAGGQEEHTIVVFSSDQGLAVGSHGLMGKQNLYESGMNVPLIFGGPGLPKEKRTKAMCYLADIFPTLGDLAGVTGPEGSEGLSLVPVIKGTASVAQPVIFTAYRDVQRAVRDERWKLIRYPHVDRTQLFDLQSDPFELTNLADKPEQAAKLKDMLELLKAAQAKFGDTAPLSIPNPKPAAWTPPK